MEEEGCCTDEEEEITTHESLNRIEKSATVYDLPIPFPPITNLSVDSKRPELNVGDKPDVQTKVLQPVGLNVDVRPNNVWENHGKLGLSIADRIRRSKEAAKVRIEYFPPVKTPEGKSRVLITKDDLLKSAKAYTWHLYGYFLGTSMDFNRVNFCLKRDWKQFDIAEITKSPHFRIKGTSRSSMYSYRVYVCLCNFGFQ
ncbi:hypothetical protein HanPI659440_Chr15g0583801 [Helianthus annuus]|nr:hypothetical protein HanPI659440_Chr15g0583801 [Helianthus annuus]